jgi:hypothetical protein
MRSLALLVSAAVVAMQAFSLADQQHAPHQAEVGFGVFPTVPLGDASSGCAQTGVGGPTDPCSYKLHHLVPEETTIARGGEVTFHVHGGGHAMAIYQVSKKTNREDLGQFLCPGQDPETILSPFDHVCNGTTGPGQANAAAQHIIKDGKGDVVIVASPGGAAHPDNRVWYEPGRVMSAGGNQFLVGVGTGVTATTGQLVTYRFDHPGRYLVICMNRSHFLNDWMFGFVNVVGD